MARPRRQVMGRRHRRPGAGPPEPDSRRVRQRDRAMERFGRSNVPALLVASLRALRRFPTVRVRVSAEMQTHLCDTPFVFIGNNEYEVNLLELSRRTALDRSQLCL